MAELNPQFPPPQVVTREASACAPETQGLGRLYGKTPPRWQVVREEPWHRQAAYLFATGDMSAKQVAQAMDKEPETMRNLLRQPWFQERVTGLMAEHGGQDVMALFKAEAFNSVVTLVELRDSPKAPPAVRRASANDILDRAYGKPKQFLETSAGPTSDDPVAEARRLEEENRRLESRL